jgi:2'-5' RNA ligase
MLQSPDRCTRIAITLPENVKASLRHLQKALETLVFKSWTPARELHLNFFNAGLDLGVMPHTRRQAWTHLVRDFASRLEAAPQLTLGAVSLYRGGELVVVLVVPSAELLALRDEFIAHVKSKFAGTALEAMAHANEQLWEPHITLGRIPPVIGGLGLARLPQHLDTSGMAIVEGAGHDGNSVFLWK